MNPGLVSYEFGRIGAEDRGEDFTAFEARGGKMTIGAKSIRGAAIRPFVIAIWIAFSGICAAHAAELVPSSAPDEDAVYDDYDDFFDDEFAEVPVGYPDPAESTNRGVFAFNRQIDKWILDPLTEGYQFVVPKPGRIAISRFFLNLSAPQTLVNDLLQLEWIDAGVTTARFIINTTVGLAGFFDVAEKVGLEGHASDFGQTLALAGTPSGPYIVLPVLGPANIRDGIGNVIDGFFQPTYYILGPAKLLFGTPDVLIYGGTSGLSTRERHYQELKALEDSSVDFYAAMRSGYYQDRIGEIWGRRDDHGTSGEPVFTFCGSEDQAD